MNIVVIEDEKITANELVRVISHLRPGFIVCKVLETVAQAKIYFKLQPNVDLVFSDIQLGDGLSFEIFKDATIDVPVIFCTAYNEFMLEAFRVNGIAYVLKPFDNTDIEQAIAKFEKITKKNQLPITELMRYLNRQGEPPASKSILLHEKDKIIPLGTNDIAVIHLEKGTVRLHTFNNQVHYPSQSLEEFDDMDLPYFFRANRQTIVHRRAVKEAAQHFNRKLLISLNIAFSPQILVSKEKTPAFYFWLKNT